MAVEGGDVKIVSKILFRVMGNRWLWIERV